MRIAVTGSAGMLGRELAAVVSAAPQGHELVLLTRSGCDITQPEAVRASLGSARPQVVIHAAAYTDVDGCELNPALAMQVNAEGARHVAQAAAECGARLIYISTDYVFDGALRRPYTEADTPNPLSVYGRSKLEGERAVREHPNHLVVRTAWVYGRYGRHFISAILERAQRGQPLRVVQDQVGCPTWTRDLAQALAALLASDATGIVHAAGGGFCSRHEFAVAAVEEAAARGLAPRVPVEPISSAEAPRPAPRPAYSVLSNCRLAQLGIGPLREWRQALEQFLEEAN